MNPQEAHRRMARVASRLSQLPCDVVFVGGVVVGGLLSDPAAEAVRHTLDVDAVIGTSSRAHFDAVQERLRATGWSPDPSPGAPICRWRTPDGDVVDLMPDDPGILGFANPWYRLALDTRWLVETNGGVRLPVVWAPVFVLTKLVAFEDRGRGDLFGSHDLEDLVTVFDGRRELDDEMLALPDDGRRYAAEALARLLAHPDLAFALPGHVDPTSDTQTRAEALLVRWKSLADRLRMSLTPDA